VRSLVAALAALALAGSALAADGQPRHALTKKGQDIARSIVLKRGDLGQGFVAQPRPKDDTLPKGARCDALDESDLTVTGDADSPDFRLASGPVFVTIGSTAQVYRTVREANASWRRGTSAQTATCLADIVRLSAPAARKLSVVSSKRQPFQRVAPKTVAYRVVLSFPVQGQRIRFYVDVIIMQRGRIQAGLLFSSVGVPVDRSEQVVLARRLADRIADASLPSGPTA
jgi:hypothetical protein